MKNPTTSSNEMVEGNGEKENEEASPKIDAFQFMMNSRHRSIGRNSPGRELVINVSPDAVLSKKELNTRKSRLESWAEKKGALKRKREYEEIGNCINYKIEQRGRKLKKMLKVECQSDDEVVTKRKRCGMIETDSENSNDVVLEMSEAEEKTSQKSKKKKAKRSRLSLKNSKEEQEMVSDELLKLTPKSIKSWRFKIKLTMNENSDSEKSETKSESDLAAISENKIAANLTAENGLSVKIDNISSEDENGIVTTLTPKTDILHNSKSEEALEISGIETENEVENITTENGTFNKSQSAENELTLKECVVVDDENNDSLNENKRILRTRRTQPKIYDDYYLSDSDDDTDKKKNTVTKEKKNVKVAPVFLKAVPKPKLDPKVIEARRQFLLSGVPSSLKKEMEKQQCIEEVDFDVFPTISHVQQKSSNIFWNLPKVEMKLNNEESNKIEIKKFAEELINLHSDEQRSKELPVSSKIQNCKNIIKEIKSQNPDYPVYKIFNSIYTKSGYKTEKLEEKIKAVPKRRGRPKKNAQSQKSPEPVLTKPEENSPHAMWTEKYRARTSLEIIGNHNAIASLKEWLTGWSNMGKDLKRGRSSDSESDFNIDSDSRDSMKIYRNSVVLRGPSGCGKTAAVYAVCNELGFNVIEVNASSKRTGKRLLQELQEATQSHQVRKKDNVLSSFIKEKEEKPSKPRMCVLLVEDIDIVFEQDEGFTAALAQILTTSKRPVILTTTDEPSNSVQKIISDYQLISFSSLPSILTIWLQIVCLVEGCYVKSESLEELFSYYGGDIRRTLLQLQLYVNSGGCLSQNEAKDEINTEVQIDNDFKVDDDNLNLSDPKLDLLDSKDSVPVHGNCLSACHVVNNYKSFSLPRCNSLGVIWWNFPTLLNLPNFSNVRLERTGKTNVNTNSITHTEKENMKMLLDCYEALAFTDVVCGQNQFHENLERRWRPKIKDSLGLEENTETYIDNEFSKDLAYTLISGRIKLYREKYQDTKCKMNMAVPVSTERKWRSKQLASEEKFYEAFTHLDFLGRKSVALDFMPCLRTIARSECERAAHNTKRGNRFYSYFRHLGVHASDVNFRNVCDVFKAWD